MPCGEWTAKAAAQRLLVTVPREPPRVGERPEHVLASRQYAVAGQRPMGLDEMTPTACACRVVTRKQTVDLDLRARSGVLDQLVEVRRPHGIAVTQHLDRDDVESTSSHAAAAMGICGILRPSDTSGL
jgi:hypothetical protein